MFNFETAYELNENQDGIIYKLMMMDLESKLHHNDSFKLTHPTLENDDDFEVQVGNKNLGISPYSEGVWMIEIEDLD